MNVLVVEPRIAPYEKEINGLLKEMQTIVGGRITTTDLPQEGAVIVSNDESICLGMEFNRKIDDERGGIFGTFFICGNSGDDLCSLSPDQMDYFKKRFHQAEVLLAVNNGRPVIAKIDPFKPPSQEPPKRPPKTH